MGMNIIAELNRETAAAKAASVPEFGAGDTLRVHVSVKEGDKARVQIFEGICIARNNRAAGSSFTVRKLSFGEGVERVFPLFSPVLDKIEVVRRGDVRRSKLYYLRGRTGKSARIMEKARAMGWVAKAGDVAVASDVAPELAAAETAAAPQA